MKPEPTIDDNELLRALPGAEKQRLVPHLELVVVPAGTVIAQPGATQQYAYFPTSSIVSWTRDLADGRSTVIATTGKEGVIDPSLFLDGIATQSRAEVMTGGHAFRLRASVVKREVGRGSPLRVYALRYMQAMLAQVAQTAVCSWHHSIEQQLCRWLLASLDRLATNRLAVTQEVLANIVGMRRERVAEIARTLREAGLIQCTRGFVTVLDRVRLEKRACECYMQVRHELARLLTYSTPERAARV